MAIDKMMLDSLTSGYKFYINDLKNRNITGEYYDTVEALYNRILELGEECSDMNQMYAKMQNENIMVKLTDAYTKALTEEGTKKYGSSGNVYDDNYLMKNNVEALRNSIKAMRDSFDDVMKNASPSEKMRLMVDNNPEPLIKSVEDMIALSEQPGMTYANFLRLQIEQGLDTVMQGVTTRSVLEKILYSHKALMSPDYEIRMWEEKVQEYEKAASRNRFNIVDLHEWALISDRIELKYIPERTRRTRIFDLFMNILGKIDEWCIAYCSYTPYEIFPWSGMPLPDALRSLKRIQKTAPGLVKELEKMLQHYFGLRFIDIVDNPDFRHHVLTNFVDESQELIEFLLLEVYPQCKPFCDLPSEIIHRREQMHRGKREGNPGRNEPYRRMKRYYNEVYGEGYMEQYMKEQNMSKMDSVDTDSQAAPWNYDAFLQNVKGIS
ncbi:MAG: hypothetical protein IK032_07330 [Bacteroidales bacterium]|nr:hypothetical protein [Bacteroidales bacterium]